MLGKNINIPTDQRSDSFEGYFPYKISGANIDLDKKEIIYIGYTKIFRAFTKLRIKLLMLVYLVDAEVVKGSISVAVD